MSNEKKNDGGPAFPTTERVEWHEDLGQGKPGYREYMATGGMTLRQYACIHLRVPETGEEWLDDIIRKAQKNDFAAKVMQGAMANTVAWFDMSQKAKVERVPPEVYAADAAYRKADAMIKAREQ